MHVSEGKGCEAMTVTIGRIVHYYDEYGSLAAAIVTGALGDDRVDLTYFPHGFPGVSCTSDVKYSETPKPGHWTWPPRVETSK